MMGSIPDEARLEVTDLEKLHELHAGAHRESIAVAAHVGGAAVAGIKAGESAGREHRRLGGNRDRFAACDMPSRGADDLTGAAQEIDDEKVAGLAMLAVRLITPRSVFETVGPVLRKST
jgi:hypothetical protein